MSRRTWGAQGVHVQLPSMDRERIRHKVRAFSNAILSSLAGFQARFQIEAAHPCSWYCENKQLGDCSHFKK